MEKENLPKFPELPVPDSITESQVYVIENNDIQSYKDIEELIKLMYDNPHATFEFYFQLGSVSNPYISKAMEEKQIHSDIVEAYYYKHPKFERDYIKIKKEFTEYDWEKQVAESTPMFFKKILTLTEKQRKKIDSEELMTSFEERMKKKMKLSDRITRHPIIIALFILGSIASVIALVYMFLPASK